MAKNGFSVKSRRRISALRAPQPMMLANITGTNKTGSRTDNLDLQLDLVGFPSLPAGAYVGVLNIRAVTQ